MRVFYEKLWVKDWHTQNLTEFPFTQESNSHSMDPTLFSGLQRLNQLSRADNDNHSGKRNVYASNLLIDAY